MLVSQLNRLCTKYSLIECLEVGPEANPDVPLIPVIQTFLKIIENLTNQLNAIFTV